MIKTNKEKSPKYLDFLRFKVYLGLMRIGAKMLVFNYCFMVLTNLFQTLIL